jgi:hypothetical protein
MQMDVAVVGVFVPIVAIVFGVGVAIVAIWTGYRQRALRMELRHRERLAAIDKGLELPPEAIDPALDPVNTRPRHLLRGLVWSLLGIAVAATFYNMAGDEEAWIGSIPFSIGLAYLVFYVVEGRKESAAALAGGASRGDAGVSGG